MVGEKIGLLAGSGRLPILAAQGIRAAGKELVAVGITGEAGADLDREVPSRTLIPVGELHRIREHFLVHGVTQLVLAGKVNKSALFAGTPMDEAILALLARLPQKNDDAILGACVSFFADAGIQVLPQKTFLGDLLVGKGVFTRREPDSREKRDVVFGFQMAKKIGGLDLGQSVVVKMQAVLAVEAVEGTNETIRRGGFYGRGGAVLVKVSKPQQDERFDVPTVGLETIQAMRVSGVTVLAIEAEHTLFIDREICLAEADNARIAVVAVGSAGEY